MECISTSVQKEIYKFRDSLNSKQQQAALDYMTILQGSKSNVEKAKAGIDFIAVLNKKQQKHAMKIWVDLQPSVDCLNKKALSAKKMAPLTKSISKKSRSPSKKSPRSRSKKLKKASLSRKRNIKY